MRCSRSSVSYDLYRASVDATGPLPVGQPGSLLYRFNVDYLDRDTFRDFVSEEQIYVAPSLTWTIGDRSEARLAFEYRNQDIPTDSFDYGIPAIGTRPSKISIRRNLGDPTVEFLKRDDYIVNLDFFHRFTPDWTLSYKGMFAQEDLAYSAAFPLSLNEATGDLSRGLVRHSDPADNTTWFTSLEATGHIPLLGMEHTLLVGADYYKATREESFDIAIDTVPTINIFNPSYRFVPQTEIPRDPFKQANEWYGVYVQDQIKFLEKWRLLVGARFDDASSASGAPETQEVKTDTAKPRVGLLYQPWPWLSLYGHYVESLGAPNGGLTADNQPLEPETAIQYEAGVKAELWEGRLAATLAFYDLTKQNIRTPDPANPFFNIAIGEAESRGVELDVTGQVAERVSLIGSYAYTDTEITKDNRPGIEGNRLHSAPRHAGSFWTKYAVTDQFTVGAGVFAAGEREGDDENTFQLPGYVRVDAMAAYHWKLWASRLTVQLNVNNLLDKEYFEAAISRVNILPGAPVTVLGSIRLEY